MANERLLLISSSQVDGQGYMDHCMPEIIPFLGSGIKEILFIPYAKKDRDEYAEKIGERFGKAGLNVRSIHSFTDPGQAVRDAKAVFTGGGNTFLLLTELYARKLLEPLRQRVRGGMPYFGSSAGSNIAGMTIKTTNDMPIIYPPSFDALGLLPVTINPHFTEPLPGAPRAGETRAERIQEFHEWNSNPVVGMRQEAMLLVENDSILIKGGQGVKLFRKDKEPEDFIPGQRLDFLL
jgi:dipeptidase E